MVGLLVGKNRARWETRQPQQVAAKKEESGVCKRCLCVHNKQRTKVRKCTTSGRVGDEGTQLKAKPS